MSCHGVPRRCMPYPTYPYYVIMSHHVIPYHTIPYHTIPYRTVPYLQRQSCAVLSLTDCLGVAWALGLQDAGYHSLLMCRMVVGLGEASFVSLASPLIGKTTSSFKCLLSLQSLMGFTVSSSSPASALIYLLYWSMSMLADVQGYLLLSRLLMLPVMGHSSTSFPKVNQYSPHVYSCYYCACTVTWD